MTRKQIVASGLVVCASVCIAWLSIDAHRRSLRLTPVPAPVKAAAPCAPNPAKEIQDGKIHATITDTQTTHEQLSWIETHKVECGENYRSVIPSVRELERAGDVEDESKWIAEHELCEPDGLK
jgi:hypothetical protein